MEKKTKKKLSKSAIILIVGIVIIAIPCFIFAGILLSSALESSKPVNGSRFDNDLAVKITNEDITNVESALSSLSNVEKVEIDGTTTGQLVVMVDIIDTASEQQASDIAEQAYQKVISVLPISKYFTASETNKNYDLSVHAFNRTSADDNYASWSYAIVTKNSMMELPSTQIVSTPLDDALAKELRGESQEAQLQVDETEGTSGESGE